ncbi:MAG: hypothetical protein MK086_10880 [Flavobacteriales bacterium]|nr:hypothetical protein [Flavobacteriales bacterium]
MKKINGVVLLGVVVILCSKLFTSISLVLPFIVVAVGLAIALYGVFFYRKDER